jgi:hypothetical protein
MLFCFANIPTEILLNILGYSFCTEHHILVHFCQMLLPSKHCKLYAQKLLSFGNENVGEIDTW